MKSLFRYMYAMGLIVWVVSFSIPFNVHAELLPVVRGPVTPSSSSHDDPNDPRSRDAQPAALSSSGNYDDPNDSRDRSARPEALQQPPTQLGTPWSERPVNDLSGTTDLASKPEGKAGFLIVCDGALPEGSAIRPADYDECDFEDLIELIKKAIDFAIVVAISFSVVLFMYAGLMYMLSTDKVDRTATAKKIIRTTLIGLLVILCAWIVINTAMQLLGLKDKYNGLQSVDQTLNQ